MNVSCTRPMIGGGGIGASIPIPVCKCKKINYDSKIILTSVFPKIFQHSNIYYLNSFIMSSAVGKLSFSPLSFEFSRANLISNVNSGLSFGQSGNLFMSQFKI